MTFVEVKCPRCHAPVDAPAAAFVTCRFCGASLRDAKAPAAKTRIDAAVIIERVGPSNRARAWDVLTRIAQLAPAEAERIVTSAPCDVVVWEHRERAEELAFALREAGIGARVEEREIILPAPVVLPDRSVHLDAVGADKVAVMKVVREHLECGVYDAKALIDRAPCVVARSLEGGRASTFVEALTSAGATAKLGAPS